MRERHIPYFLNPLKLILSFSLSLSPTLCVVVFLLLFFFRVSIFIFARSSFVVYLLFPPTNRWGMKTFSHNVLLRLLLNNLLTNPKYEKLLRNDTIAAKAATRVQTTINSIRAAAHTFRKRKLRNFLFIIFMRWLEKFKYETETDTDTVFVCMEGICLAVRIWYLPSLHNIPLRAALCRTQYPYP